MLFRESITTFRSPRSVCTLCISWFRQEHVMSPWIRQEYSRLSFPVEWPFHCPPLKKKKHSKETSIVTGQGLKANNTKKKKKKKLKQKDQHFNSGIFLNTVTENPSGGGTLLGVLLFATLAVLTPFQSMTSILIEKRDAVERITTSFVISFLRDNMHSFQVFGLFFNDGKSTLERKDIRSSCCTLPS